MEIEKKFLIKRLPEDLSKYRKEEIEQGYLCKDPTLRVRKLDDKYILTYKARIKSEKSVSCADSGNSGEARDVHINDEREVFISREAYEHLLKKADGNIITKDRYVIPIGNGLNCELDIFKGKLSGLVFGEVEFPSEEAAAEFAPPDWFGKNVSSDRRYTNTFLTDVTDVKSVFGEELSNADT